MLKSTSSFNLGKSKYTIKEVPNGIFVDAPVKGNKLVSSRRQCAMYCNDVIGIPGFFADYFESQKGQVGKIKRITTQNPRPGSVMLLRQAMPYGHVRLVETTPGGKQAMKDTDMITWSESNYDYLEHFRRSSATLGQLRKTGILAGFTYGLDIVTTPPMEDTPSTYAIPAFEAAAKFGFSDNNPLAPMDAVRLRQAMLKLPSCTLEKAMKDCLKDDDTPLTYQDFITALWKAGAFT